MLSGGRMRIDFSGRTDSIKPADGEAKARGLPCRLRALVLCKVRGDTPDAAVIKWVVALPPTLRQKIESAGVLDGRSGAGSKPLLKHVQDFELALEAKEVAPRHVKLTGKRLRDVIEGCGFKVWSDVSGSKVETFLKRSANSASGWWKIAEPVKAHLPT